MRSDLLLFVTFALAATLAISPLAAGDHWPTWRGPNGDGSLEPATPAETYPTEWSAEKNILWRTPLEAPGNSSPVVWGERLFMTQGENENQLRSLLCFDTRDGKLLWKKSVERPANDPTHQTNPGVSASPTTDGEIVVAWHGNAGLHAFGFDGNARWSADLGDDYKHIWGPNAASPVLHENLVIVHSGPGLVARLVAVDKADGSVVWNKRLPGAESEKFDQFKGSWATPRIIDNDGRAEMLVPLPGRLSSFDPATGDELWHCTGLGDLCYSNALVADDTLVAMSGFGGPALALRRPGPDERGDLTESHRLWHVALPKPPQRIGSGQIIGDHIYNVSANGVAQCIGLKTGEVVWNERLGRESWSSLNLVGGLLYSTDKSSTTFVIEPSHETLKVIATNPVAPPQNNANTTPAFANGTIYLRSPTALFAIRE